MKGMLFLLFLVAKGMGVPSDDDQRDRELTLVMKLTGGLSNMRIQFLKMFAAAKELGARVVLPELTTDGTQSADDGYKMSGKMLPFSYFYKTQPFEDYLGDPFYMTAPLRCDLSVEPKVVSDVQLLGDLFKNSESGCLYVEATVAGPALSPELVEHYLAMDSGTMFHPNIVLVANVILGRMLGFPPVRPFTALHLRIEDDWKEHCRAWESISDGVARTNCFTNTEQIHKVFEMQKVPREWPVYIATGATRAELIDTSVSLLSLQYSIIMKEDVITKSELKALLGPLEGRDGYAAVEFAVCERAALFVGNSVSTFSSLLIISRKFKGTATFHYNGGDNPLEPMLFGSDMKERAPRPLKWLFVYSTLSDGEFNHYMKVAVWSGIHLAHMEPIALVYGEPNQYTDWITDQGIVLITHYPAWVNDIKEIFEGIKGTAVATSPLYERVDKAIATLLRIDFALLAWVDRYVFYADLDIVFLGRIDLEVIGERHDGLPSTFLCGPESTKAYVGFCNAGVMLLNVEFMRRTYKGFVNFVIKQGRVNNLHFKNFGPLDQGAINQFYHGQFENLDLALNWKPYWGRANDDDVIVCHFHGPKVFDYVLGPYAGVRPSFDGYIELCSTKIGCMAMVQQAAYYIVKIATVFDINTK